LRREEVAALAGVSVTWYTWIEQGRDISVSRESLEKIADALGLDAAERAYVRSLLPDGQRTPDLDGIDQAAAALQTVLDGFGINPAFVLSSRLDILASNAAARLVFVDEARLPDIERNLVWQMFCNPDSRTLIVDWEDNARGIVAILRANWARRAADHGFGGLIEIVSNASPEFRDWWSQPDMSIRPLERKQINHPVAGPLAFRQTGLGVLDRPDMTLVVNTPWPGTDTDERVRRLMAEKQSTNESD
jgi:transcriptional regulator with XRE-family HTH domain